MTKGRNAGHWGGLMAEALALTPGERNVHAAYYEDKAVAAVFRECGPVGGKGTRVGGNSAVEGVAGRSRVQGTLARGGHTGGLYGRLRKARRMEGRLRRGLKSLPLQGQPFAWATGYVV